MESDFERREAMKALDLFCGCGGISAGLRAAGFEVIAGVDIEPNYITTFTHNFLESKSLNLDLSSTKPHEFMELIGIRPGEIDLLAGGPPCQGFSKNVPRKNRYLDSSNNLLVRTFLDYCEALKPNIILMENVAEIKNGFDQTYTEEIIERLEEEGYTVSYDVLNAADYGIPQRRRRAFFLACKGGKLLEFPKKTHSKADVQKNIFSLPEHVCVWDAIGDLPSVKSGEGEDYTEYSCAPFSEYQNLMRNGSTVVRNHVARKLQPTQHARLAALKPGQGLKDLPKNLQVKGGYSGAYGRLTKDMIAPTITRWVFHPGSGRWGHPEDTRVLTIREAARIQGFEDSFEFVGTYVQQAAQLGNAVPPLLARRIIENILPQIGVSSFESRYIKSSNVIFSSGPGNLKETECSSLC